MNYGPVDPADIVVLFADLQAGIIERAATNDVARLRRGVFALAKLTRHFDIPAIVTTASTSSASAMSAAQANTGATPIQSP